MVEGRDDEYVVKHICGARGFGVIDNIHPYGGADPLLEGIGPRLKESDITVLGIILDADTDLDARWQAVTAQLRKSGYEDVPNTPSPSGTIILAPEHSLLPRVGVWLMPDNALTGILEDFLRFLVPQGNPLLAHVERSIDAIPTDLCRFNGLMISKARIHTWLAWQEEPGKPLGQAISARYLDPTLPAGRVFTDWLQQTFFFE